MAKIDANSAKTGAKKVRAPKSARTGVAARLTQAIGRGDIRQIVEVSGVSRRSISRILAGEPAKRPALIALAGACGVSINWLADGEGPMEYPAVGSTTPEGHTVAQGPVMPIPGLFATLDFDGAADSLEEALQQFASRNAKPTTRELVLLMALIYDQRLEKERARATEDAKTPPPVRHE